jgi:hypothetical protein
MNNPGQEPSWIKRTGHGRRYPASAAHVAEVLDPGGYQQPREEQEGSRQRRQDQSPRPCENEDGGEQPQEYVDYTLTIDNVILKL